MTLLATFAPGLARAPISAALGGDSPAVTMSWLPGTELGTAPVTPAQVSALAVALERLWRSVPPTGQDFFPAVTPNPVAFTGQVRAMMAARPALGDGPAVTRAHASAAVWLDRCAIEEHSHMLTWDTTHGRG